jgi:hypothetical protein
LIVLQAGQLTSVCAACSRVGAFQLQARGQIMQHVLRGPLAEAHPKSYFAGVEPVCHKAQHLSLAEGRASEGKPPGRKDLTLHPTDLLKEPAELCMARNSRVVLSSTVSTIMTATAASARVSTTRISGRILSWAATPAWEIGSRAWT